jgi:hypothetical protein
MQQNKGETKSVSRLVSRLAQGARKPQMKSFQQPSKRRRVGGVQSLTMVRGSRVRVGSSWGSVMVSLAVGSGARHGEGGMQRSRIENLCVDSFRQKPG